MLKKFVWLTFVFAACFAFTSPAQADLVAYYPFDGNVNDMSGNGKNGVYWSNGGTTTSPTFGTDPNGDAGKALSLQAFDSYDTNGIGSTQSFQGVVLPDESFFDFTEEISICAWVRFNSVTGVANQGNYGGIVTKGNQNQYQLTGNWYSASGYSRFYWRVQGSTWNNSTYSVRPGTTNDPDALDFDQWYHVVVTYSSGNGTASIYVNGQLNVAKDLSNNPMNVGADQAMAIGAYALSNYQPDQSRNTHDGLIDEVAIFNNCLPDNDIAIIYSSGIPTYLTGHHLTTITQSDGSTDVCENSLIGPTTDSYTVGFLGKNPGDPNITVTMGYDSDQITVSPTQVYLTGAESTPWSFDVTVTAINDSVEEGDHYTDVTHTVSCPDPNYNWGHNVAELADVTVNITDDDVKGVSVTQTGGTTIVQETFSTTDSYTVKLTGTPVGGNAVLSLTYDSSQITVSPTELTFTTANWPTEQTVTVQAVDDEIFESEAGAYHDTDISGSFSGGGYNAISVPDVTVNIVDDEPYCGDPNTTANRLAGDIWGPDNTWDCYVDLYDLAKMTEEWLTCIDPTDDSCESVSWPTIP